MLRLLAICVVICFLTDVVSGTKSNKADIRSTVQSLFNKVESEQCRQDTPFIPPMFWQKRRGMWESDVRFYFHGHEELFLLREVFSIYDDNMFATAWIASCMIESYRYGKGPKPSDEMIMDSVLAIKEYHDKNVDYANSLMTFWPQRYNATYKAWQSYPENLHHFFDLAINTNFTGFEKFLNITGFVDISLIMERLLKTTRGYLRAFEIPPDFDDTFVNIGFGALLAEVKDDFPASHAQWLSQNTNLTSVFDALKKYSYRPMSKNDAINAIDARTYFYIRHFLEDAQSRGEDLALVSTWIQDLDELKHWQSRGVIMPLSINNVDATVAANVVFGTTAAMLNEMVDASILDDPDLQQIYVNTTNLIVNMIETNFSNRHDLALLYYPSAIEFYWFVARTYGEIRRVSDKGPLPHPVLAVVEKLLDGPLHIHMTDAVLNLTQHDTDGTAFFDDFVGDGDLDKNNNTVVRGQDRLFTTGMAMNALLSTWTIFDEKTKQLVWEDVTPEAVKTTVSKAADFLNKHVLGLKYQPWNAFFSGSVKGQTTSGGGYPTTRTNSSRYFLGVRGIIPEDEYEADMKKRHTPIDFHGYNHYPDYWPFWSSPPYTHVTNMLALAKFSNTVSREELESSLELDPIY